MQISTYNVWRGLNNNKGCLQSSNVFNSPQNTFKLLNLPPKAPNQLQLTPNGLQHLQMAPIAPPKLQHLQACANQPLHVHAKPPWPPQASKSIQTQPHYKSSGPITYWDSIEEEREYNTIKAYKQVEQWMLEWDMAFSQRPLLIPPQGHLPSAFQDIFQELSAHMLHMCAS